MMGLGSAPEEGVPPLPSALVTLKKPTTVPVRHGRRFRISGWCWFCILTRCCMSTGNV